MVATTNINEVPGKVSDWNEKFVVVDTSDTAGNPKTKLVNSSEISKTWHEHTASEITDFDSEVANNATVASLVTNKLDVDWQLRTWLAADSILRTDVSGAESYIWKWTPGQIMLHDFTFWEQNPTPSIFGDWSLWDLTIANWETETLSLDTVYNYNNITVDSWGTLTFEESSGDVAIIKVKNTLTVNGTVTTSWLRSGYLTSRASIDSALLSLTEWGDTGQWGLWWAGGYLWGWGWWGAWWAWANWFGWGWWWGGARWSSASDRSWGAWWAWGTPAGTGWSSVSNSWTGQVWWLSAWWSWGITRDAAAETWTSGAGANAYGNIWWNATITSGSQIWAWWGWWSWNQPWANGLPLIIFAKFIAWTWTITTDWVEWWGAGAGWNAASGADGWWGWGWWGWWGWGWWAGSLGIIYFSESGSVTKTYFWWLWGTWGVGGSWAWSWFYSGPSWSNWSNWVSWSDGDYIYKKRQEFY